MKLLCLFRQGYILYNGAAREKGREGRKKGSNSRVKNRMLSVLKMAVAESGGVWNKRHEV